MGYKMTLDTDLTDLSNEVYAIYKKLGAILEQNDFEEAELPLLHMIQMDLVQDEHALRQLAKIIKK